MAKKPSTIDVPGYPKRAATLEQDGERLSQDNKLPVSDDFSSKLLLEDILLELRKIELHLHCITGLEPSDEEVKK